jgi:hypothetical protein
MLKDLFIVILDLVMSFNYHVYIVRLSLKTTVCKNQLLFLCLPLSHKTPKKRENMQLCI